MEKTAEEQPRVDVERCALDVWRGGSLSGPEGPKPEQLVRSVIDRLGSVVERPLEALFWWLFLDHTAHACLAFLEAEPSYASLLSTWWRWLTTWGQADQC
jgi:hypothetical protein